MHPGARPSALTENALRRGSQTPRMSEGLSPEARQRFELVGVAGAWLSTPEGYPREIRRLLHALDAEERPLKVFHLFSGNWLGKGGLLLMTDHRLLFAPTRLLGARVQSIELDEIRRAYIVPSWKSADLKIESETAGTFGFWRAGGGAQVELERILDVIREAVGPQLTD